MKNILYTEHMCCLSAAAQAYEKLRVTDDIHSQNALPFCPVLPAASDLSSTNRNLRPHLLLLQLYAHRHTIMQGKELNNIRTSHNLQRGDMTNFLDSASTVIDSGTVFRLALQIP